MKNGMKNLTVLFALFIASTLGANAQKVVGGSPMFPTKTIVENAANSKYHTTLVAAVKEADLADDLMAAGPYTVFAPDNMAFGKLPDGTIDKLMKPSNKKDLSNILTYHVVAGEYTSADLLAMIKKGKGRAYLKTLEGGTLTFKLKTATDIMVQDEKGIVAEITIPDIKQSNGIIHSIDTVLMPM